MLCVEDHWKVVMGINLMLVWLSGFTIEASLIHLSSLVDGCCILILLKKEFPISLQMLRALVLLIPLTHTLSFCPLCQCTQTQRCWCTAHGHLLYARSHECISTVQGAGGKGGNWGDKVRHKGGKRKRQNRDRKQVEGLRFILGGIEHEINLCLSASVAQWEPQCIMGRPWEMLPAEREKEHGSGT